MQGTYIEKPSLEQLDELKRPGGDRLHVDSEDDDNNGGDTGPDTQFDIADIHEALDAADAARQEDIWAAIRNERGVWDTKWEESLVKKVYLSELMRIYENRDADMAIDFLRYRTKLIVDDEFQIDSTDPNISWTLAGHYVDSILAVSRTIGLGAILPMNNSDSVYELVLDLNRPGKLFRGAKRAMTLFSTFQRTTYLGKARGEEVWLVMRPRKWRTERDNGAGATGDKEWDTRMKPEHRKQILIFLCTVLNDCVPNKPFTIWDRYPVDADGQPWKVEAACDIL